MNLECFTRLWEAMASHYPPGNDLFGAESCFRYLREVPDAAIEKALTDAPRYSPDKIPTAPQIGVMCNIYAHDSSGDDFDHETTTYGREQLRKITASLTKSTAMDEAKEKKEEKDESKQYQRLARECLKKEFGE